MFITNKSRIFQYNDLYYGAKLNYSQKGRNLFLIKEHLCGKILAFNSDLREITDKTLVLQCEYFVYMALWAKGSDKCPVSLSCVYPWNDTLFN